MLLDLQNAFEGEQVTFRELLDKLQHEAFGLLLLMLALPITIPNLPGISTIFGVLLLVPGWQMMLGRRKPWLPGILARQSIKREHLNTGIRAGAKVLKLFEHIAKPRLGFLTRAPFENLIGLMVFILALVLILPIPAGNFPPAVAISVMAMALLRRDGLLALLSVPLFFIALAIAWLAVGLIFLAFINSPKLFSWLD